MKNRIKRKYREFVKYGGTQANPVRFLYYLYLLRSYHTTPREFFEFQLYKLLRSHKDYFGSTVKAEHAWHHVKKLYFPDSNWLRDSFFRIDFWFSKFLYPGLDARDYFSYEFYSIRHGKRKNFITEGALARMDRHFNDNFRDPNISNAKTILAQKDLFNTVFSDYIGRKWIVGQADITESDLDDFCRGLEAVIVKPVDGIQGKQVSKLSASVPEERALLREKLKTGHFIAEECVRQHPALAALNPSSVNTIRIFTVFHNGDVHITGSALRIGRAGSVTDNYTAGGYAAEIDISTGIVTSRAVCKQGQPCFVHPDSGKAIIGFRIPQWQQMLACVKAAHLRILPLRYIGWDICVTDTDRVILIEANTGGGVDVQQHPGLTGKRHIYRKLY